MAAKPRGLLVYIRLLFASSQDLQASLASQASHRLFRVVGLARDARYGGMREGARPVAYVPFAGVRSDGTSVPQNWGTFIMRTSSANPLAMPEALRQEVSQARPEFRMSRVCTQLEINPAQTVRERLLAMLALFFGVVAAVLGGVGLYGVLHYSVLERQREMGIRVAIGAPVAPVVRIVTVDAFLMVLVGAAMGLASGLALVRYMAALF
jgi:predicted lysophospholipase L1 biosynthesis ABC-type transport system permease subunit